MFLIRAQAREEPGRDTKHELVFKPQRYFKSLTGFSLAYLFLFLFSNINVSYNCIILFLYMSIPLCEEI